ncbi:efflux RND transporter permease subunit [Paraglaciecola polaris]|uniref:efflux RND transporter permease subunit n=1 Tax=Paraglaciecola polaris TaxID=222814 RepID=UPI003AB96F6F
MRFSKPCTQDGVAIRAAAVLACQERFRSIVLTTSTTIAGMLPLLFETSLQGQVLIPLVISIAFGLAFSTVLILVVLPCTYTVLYEHKNAINN